MTQSGPSFRAFPSCVLAQLFVACVLTVCVTTAQAAEFFSIESVESSTSEDDFYPVVNLIEGPGEGFDAEDPYEQVILNGSEDLWVTAACGFPCDYVETTGMPVLKFDLGADRQLSEISVWGYSNTNSNGVREFSLRFATDADGPDGFGTSIDLNPLFPEVLIDTAPRQSFRHETVMARYVEFTAVDNYFEEPGDGSGGEIPGGDRVGLGEVAFEIIEGFFFPGDFNSDGAVDTLDFQILADNFNTTDSEFSDGDINFDRQVNLVDFVEFREVFESAEGTAAAVPEPFGASLALTALLGLGCFARRSRRGN